MPRGIYIWTFAAEMGSMHAQPRSGQPPAVRAGMPAWKCGNFGILVDRAKQGMAASAKLLRSQRGVARQWQTLWKQFVSLNNTVSAWNCHSSSFVCPIDCRKLETASDTRGCFPNALWDSRQWRALPSLAHKREWVCHSGPWLLLGYYRKSPKWSNVAI